MTRELLEQQLNDLNPAIRQSALNALCDMAAQGEITFPPARPVVNLHCHTCFSFNGYGYSPSYIAWHARCHGWLSVACVDFDVLDAVDEFLAACRQVGIRGGAGIETRVYIPAFAAQEMNSPGEPGTAYYVGVGFTASAAQDTAMQRELLNMAQQRNQAIMGRVNPFLDPVTVDYERDVLPLTPKGNATERHLCMAYDLRSRAVFPDEDARAAFWAEKLKGDAGQIKAMFADPPVFQGVIRAKTMKSGGVGYVPPEGPDFPSLERVSQFILDCGAIPAYAFLDGLTAGELELERLLDVAAEQGAAAFNIIPDRNWNLKDPEQRKRKVARFHEAVALAQERDLPVIVGTEMNAYGQKLIDDFDAPEMAVVAPVFIEGAMILHAHTVLQSQAGMGYLSPWAKQQFASVKVKNAFFAELGRRLEPGREAQLAGLSTSWNAEDILMRL